MSSNPKAKKLPGEQDEMRRDQKLQAVILADSFSTSFRPITLKLPKVLLPLVNAPMLSYTIEFLLLNGVEELFIFCVWHAKMLQDYVASVIVPHLPANIKVQFIQSTNCSSAGDAIRELDSSGIIRSDPFILISGDVVSNMDLQKAIAFHKEKRKDDSNAVMTMVFKRVPYASGIKPVTDDLVVAMDPNNCQVLLYEDDSARATVKLPLEILAEHSSIDFRADLLDCNIYVCSPEFLLQFSDNFDYQDIRRDFIRNEAVNWELGMHIFGYEIQSEYAARVQDPHSYHAISREVLFRWAYPVVRDLLQTVDSKYEQVGRCVYKETSVQVARCATVSEGVVFGKGTEVCKGAMIHRTTIGRNCIIGRNSKIMDSHVFDGVKVDEGATIHQAIVCEGVILKRGAVISRGCILGPGTIVGENVVVPPFTRTVIPSTSSKPTQSSPASSSLLGPDGLGVAYNYEGGGDYEVLDASCARVDNVADSDDGEDDAYGKARTMRAQSIGCDEDMLQKIMRRQTVGEPEDESDEGEDGEYDDSGAMLDCSRARSAISAHDAEASARRQAAQAFSACIADMVLTGYQEGHPAENILMEIKGFKFSQNKTFADCVRGVIPSLMSAVLGSASTREAFLTFIAKFFREGGTGHTLLRALVQDTSDGLCVIESLEKEALVPSRAATLYIWFPYLLKILYDTELLSEDIYAMWIRFRQAYDDDTDNDFEEAGRRQLFNEPGVQQFVQYMQSESESENGDEEDEDEEDF